MDRRQLAKFWLFSTWIFAVLWLFIFALLLSEKAEGKTISKAYINKAFKEISASEGVDEANLRAVCWVESRHIPHAYNHRDAAKNDHAFGICQVLYSTAKGLGLKDTRCANDFNNTLPSERVYANCKLFGPRTNIMYAAKYLKKKMKKYNGNIFQAMSSYNLGRYQTCRDGWLYYRGKRFKRCIKGGPANLYYVLELYKAMGRR